MENLILVDDNDNEIGTEEKLKCHVGEGKLHRAVSIFIFNKNGEILLQKRGAKKTLWPLFWTNTCCTHPRRGESVEEAARRRLEEEMGFICPLKKIFTFKYHAKYSNIRSEKEMDHVFIGRYDGAVYPDTEEVAEWKWVDVKELIYDLEKNPQNYTPWFNIAIKAAIKNLKI